MLAVYRKPDENDWKEQLLSTLYACPKCQINYAEIQPRTFSFNSPYGACLDCDGLGIQFQFDPDRVITDRTKSLEQNPVSAWEGFSKSVVKKQIKLLEGVLKKAKIDPASPLETLTDQQWEMVSLQPIQ